MRKRVRTGLLIVAALLLLLLSFQSGRLFERFLPFLTRAAEQPAVPGAKAVTPAAALAAPGALPITPAERVAGLSAIWEAGRTNYPFFHRLPELDWDKAYREYIPQVLAAEDDLAYYRVLEEFIALLRDGHSSVVLPRALTQQLDQPQIRLLPAGGQFVVASAGAELLKAGVAKGAILTAIDGEPVASLAEAAQRRMASSTEQDRLERVARKLLEGPAGSTAALTLTLPDGTSRTVTAPRDRGVVAPAAPLTVAELGGGVYLVTINTFEAKEVVDQFNKAFPSFKGVKGLILDLRENGGGNSGYGDAIIRRIIRTPVRTAGWRSRERSPVLVARGMGERWFGLPPGLIWPAGIFGQYGGPVVVLTSPRTFSAAEDFVVRLQASGRARVVGQPTGGSTGQPLFFPLPGGGLGRVVSKWDYAPDGSEFVGVGIQPDIPVAPTAADYAAGRDPVLAKALEALGR